MNIYTFLCNVTKSTFFQRNFKNPIDKNGILWYNIKCQGEFRIPPKKRKKEVTKMMKIDFETYVEIADLLDMVDEDFSPLYSVEEIAERLNVSVDMVKYVDRAENN